MEDHSIWFAHQLIINKSIKCIHVHLFDLVQIYEYNAFIGYHVVRGILHPLGLLWRPLIALINSTIVFFDAPILFTTIIIYVECASWVPLWGYLLFSSHCRYLWDSPLIIARSKNTRQNRTVDLNLHLTIEVGSSKKLLKDKKVDFGF